MASLDDTQLCHQCGRISLRDVLDTKEGRRSKDMAGKLVLNFRPESGCPLCRLVCNAAVQHKGIDTEEAEASLPLSANLWKSTEKPAELSLYVHGRSLADFNIRISADEGTTAAEFISGRPIRSADSGFESLLVTIRAWAGDCRRNHPECDADISDTALSREPELPTRVLDVGSSTQLGLQTQIRLVKSEHMRAPYVALSHCWGDREHHPLRTTRDTERNHLAQIEMAALSTTFREAIQVTRALGIRYIWIDSLCIIQDDAGLADWRQEAGKMGSYYENAFCVIAATAAQNGSMGLLVSRPPLSVVRMACDPSNTSQGHYYISSPDLDRFDEVQNSPLNGRGWVFQEYALSRRRIHFAKGQVYWECARHFISEDGSSVSPAIWLISPRVALSDNADQQFLRFHSWWSESIKKYSGCGLTYGGDKLPAILGVTNKIMEVSPGLHCYYGHWRDGHRGMEWSLVWHASGKRALRRPRDRDGLEMQRAPSWSWSSQDGQVEFAAKWVKEGDLNRDLAILSISEPGGHEFSPYSALKVRGILRKAGRSRQHAERFHCFLFTEERAYPISGPAEMPVGSVLFDCDDRDGDEPTDFFCTLVISGYRRFILALAFVGLGDSGRQYKRIGAGEVRESSWFDGYQPEEFVIV